MSTFLEGFAARVAEQPDAIAVLAPETSWSYAELDARARELAEDLRQAGCGPGDLVALSLGRSALHVAAVLAVWRIGAAFLPLDPLAPPRRQRACLEEAGARALLRAADGGTVIDRLTSTRSAEDANDRDLAYVIYTSGSTGAPKGVRVGHGGLVPMLQAQIEAFALGAGKRALFALSVAFDASISDLGTALLSGAALVVAPSPLAPAALCAFLRLHAVTHADLPPSVLARIDPAEAPPSLETVIIGGEVCPPEIVRAWAKRLRLVNVYGPTEATICTSLVRCDDVAWDRPRLGDPLPHVEYRVEGGELLIGGRALALGYVNRPTLETERFVEREGRRYYRTGDRVQPGSEHEEGGLEFLGRIDRQVKVRGQLVSPEEIELALLAMSEVLEAAVTADLPATLTARVVLRPGARAEADALRERLAETLPRWMLPRVILEQHLPRSTTGKLERDPRTAVIVAAFREILGAEEVSRHSDFFALGGDSLAALEIAAVAQAEGVVFEPAAVLEARTPAAIAATGQMAGRTAASIEREVAGRIARASLPPARESSDPSAASSGGAWLVTGATGFLGRRVVARLLAATDRPLHCLVRARDDRAATERLARLGLSSPRLVAHAGDVSAPHLGMAPDRWRELAEQVGPAGHVVHLAAAVNQLLSFEMLAAANVTAAIEVARFTRAAAAALTHVSTLAVLAASDVEERRLDEDTVLSPATLLFGGYAQSKYAAERVVRRLVPRARIVRPGLLTGDSETGKSASSCPLATFLRALAQVGCVPRELGRSASHGERGAAPPTVDVTPVDHAAAALATLLLAPSSPPLVHLASRRGATLADLVRAVRARVDLAEVDAGTFVQRVRSRLSRESALTVASASYRLLGREVARDADLFLLTGRVFDGTLAERLTGWRCPPADDALLRRYVDHALS